MRALLVVVCVGLSSVLAGPSPFRHQTPRAVTTPDNIVSINSPDDYCLIVPKSEHTDIGDSEFPGGTTTYCSTKARYDFDSQGEVPGEFWKDVDYTTGFGSNGDRYTQLTGCINPDMLDRLNVEDEGGQYDSSGGRQGIGNPENSICIGYNHYVELIEPQGFRACIKCCDDPADCPTKLDTKGCPAVIPGIYFDCA